MFLLMLLFLGLFVFITLMPWGGIKVALTLFWAGVFVTSVTAGFFYK